MFRNLNAWAYWWRHKQSYGHSFQFPALCLACCTSSRSGRCVQSSILLTDSFPSFLSFAYFSAKFLYTYGYSSRGATAANHIWPPSKIINSLSVSQSYLLPFLNENNEIISICKCYFNPVCGSKCIKEIGSTYFIPHISIFKSVLIYLY